MKTEWERETRVCSTIGIQADLLDALRRHVTDHELGPVEIEALVCFESTSKRIKKAGLLMRMAGAGHKVRVEAVIVTPTRLVWATRTDSDAAWATSELLARLDVEDYEKSPEAALLPDRGVTVHGIAAGSGHVGSLFFGLGEGPDADHARRTLKDAVRAAHGEGPPVPASDEPKAQSAE